MITVKHLRKEFSNVTPLEDVSFEVEKGEVISIIGPSGTGKSTLLRCINRLETPTAGEIYFDGVCVTDKDCDLSTVRRKMGMVFQSFNLFGHLTVIENIMFAPVNVNKLTEAEAYADAMRLLQSVGLAEKAMSYPDELSGGQKQRVAIARALAMHPDVILFDEPTSALDPSLVGEVLSVIKNLANSGLTMLIVTHEMRFARDVSTRVLYMDEGGIYEDGTAEQIFENPQRDKTRLFIKRLKRFEINIPSESFDFIASENKIKEFAQNRFMTERLLSDLQLAFEELVIQLIMPQAKDDFKALFAIEYADKESCVVTFNYNGDKFNPFESDNELSMKILQGITAEMKHVYNGENLVSLTMKNIG